MDYMGIDYHKQYSHITFVITKQKYPHQLQC